MPNQSPGYQPDQPMVFHLRLQRKKRSSALFFWFALILSLLLLVFLFLFSGIAIAYGYYQLGERIYPGVEVNQLNLGGATTREAAQLLEQTWDTSTTILVSNGLQSHQLTPSQLGLQLDAVRTARNAYSVGRQGTILERLRRIFFGWKEQPVILPTVNLDLEAARTGLESIAPLMSKSPRDATIRVEGTEIVAVPPELGYTINIDKTLETIASDPQQVFQTGFLAVVPEPVIPAVSDVTPVLDDANELLARASEIRIFDPVQDEYMVMPVPPDRVADWLRVSLMGGEPQITLDPAMVAAYLQEISSQLGGNRAIDGEKFGAPLAEALSNNEPFTVIAHHLPTRYVVQNGDTLLKLGWNLGIPFWMILQANPGLDPDHLIAGTELVIPSKNDLLPLPVVPNKRIVISLSRQRLTVYENGAQIAQHIISTGIDRSPTQPGIFQVQTHDKNAYASVWDLYMPNFLGIYEAWPGFMNGIHGLPMLSNGRRMWANSLGRPASYGCIILGLQEAEWLYAWAEDGVIVEIRE